MKCPSGFTLVNEASNVQCKRSKCTKSQCCDKACSSFTCPAYYPLVNDSDTTRCKKAGCTEALCCEKGKNQKQRGSREYRILTTRIFSIHVEPVVYSCRWCFRLCAYGLMVSDSRRDMITHERRVNFTQLLCAFPVSRLRPSLLKCSGATRDGYL